MSLEYRAVAAPANFDDRNPRHVDTLLRKLAEAGLEDGWKLHGYSRETGKITLVRRSALASAAQQNRDGEVAVSLGGQYRASDGEKARQLLEADPRFEGLSLLRFEPHLDRATLGKLTDQEKRVRESVAATIGAKSWDVWIDSTKLGGYLMRMPGDRYAAAKHDEKLQVIAETVAGREGWFVRSDAKASTVEFVPADPPTFEATIAYPFSKLDRGSQNDMKWVMDVPVGMALGAPGQPNTLLSVPLDGNPGALVTGTPGGGKAQPLWETVVVPVSERFPDGQAAIGQLREGDEVITCSGAAAPILSLSPITLQKTYLLTLETGQEVRATSDHLWRVSSEVMLEHSGAVDVRDRQLAQRMRKYASEVSATTALTERAVADAFGLEEVVDRSLLAFALGPVGFDDGRGQTHYPADEALVATAAWLEHGRKAPWRVLTTEDLAESQDRWFVPSMAPRPVQVSEAARGERDPLAHRLLTGGAVTLGEVRAGDQYTKRALGEALAGAANTLGLIDGTTWTVPEATAELVADSLRAIGLVVTVGRGQLRVRDSAVVEIARIDPVGHEHARCLVLDDAEHLYATGSYVVTHNSVSINAIVYGLLARGWQIAIGDTIDKAADFEWCKPFVMPDGFGCQGTASTAAMVSMIYDLRTERAELIKRFKAKKWQDIPAAHRPPPVAVILDEVEGLFGLEPEPKSLPKDHPLRVEAQQHNYEVELLKVQVGKIVAQLRFAGIRVLLATQQAQANTGMSPAMKMKLPNRLLMGKLANDQVRGHALMGPKEAPHVPDNLKRDEVAGVGVGVAELDGRGGFVFKSFWSDTDEYARRLRAMGVPETDRAETSAKVIDRYIDRLDPEAPTMPEETGGFGRGPRTYEPWQLGPDGEPLTGFELANAARHASTVGAKGDG